ncbi:MAG: glycosyltransferase family 4 protein [Patescibacteria group bacterium]|jgi:glycosyltransferase involved in cell wall biosynthesis|nr:glycosyltransferase family 4 protein [Patescibacteria group bacterium]
MASKSRRDKIKLVQVIADSSLTGGPRHVSGLLSNIDKEKFDLLLIAPRGWLVSEATKIPGVEIRIVDFSSKFSLESLSKLKKDIADFRTKKNPFGPLIVHGHGPRAGLFCRLAVRPGERFVYTEHIWSDEYKMKNWLSQRLQLYGIRSICSRADLVIAVSRSVKKFLERRVLKEQKKIVVITNAIDLDDKKLVAKIDKKSDQLMVGTVGALVKRKGQVYLLQAFSRVAMSLPKARLEIVGEGPERARLRAEIKNLGLESKVQLLGEQKKPEKFMNRWDLFVLPSLSEVFGIVILEAFEAGLPVVATNVGGIPEIIKSGENGVLVPPKDTDRLAKTISWLLAEKTDRERLAKEGRQTLRDRYDWSKIIVEIENRYIALV